MKAVYLSSTVTLPDSPTRRPDAFEHDQMMENLREGFEPNGASIDDIAWDDKTVDWSGYDAAMIGTTWDYANRQAEFLATLDAISQQTQVFNSPGTVRWNSRKTYLRELDANGVRTVPTIWIEDANENSMAEAFDSLKCDDVVFKRQIGASAHGQHRIRRGEAIPEMPHPMMAQPFLSAILDDGEYSFIFVDGALSHTVQKHAAYGDYRIQSEYGGTENVAAPSREDVAVAQSVMDALNDAPLYARIDMVRLDDGKLALMEAELIEPFLYPLQGPELGQRIFNAMKKRI
ncbi:MAG: hypothetical protein HKP25_03855 [Marinicaulis sp.]|nr:hypothetical protein [Marinicaulis sp.]